MSWADALKAIIPIVVASLAWLLGEVGSFNTRLTKIEGQMPALITPQGVPTDSPLSAERRHILKEEIYKDLHDLQVRIKLMEERAKKQTHLPSQPQQKPQPLQYAKAVRCTKSTKRRGWSWQMRMGKLRMLLKI